MVNIRSTNHGGKHLQFSFNRTTSGVSLPYMEHHFHELTFAQ